VHPRGDMLAANKDFIIADTKQQAVALHKLELDVLVERYTDLISVASIAAGFSFSAIIEFEIPDDDVDAQMEGTLSDVTFNIIGTFYIAAGIALACGIYVVILSTIAVNFGYRLALSGSEHHSLDRSVAVLRKAFPIVISMGAIGLTAMLVAGFAMVFLKMENRIKAVAWTGSIIILALGFVFTGIYTMRIAHALRLGHGVHGDVKIQVPGTNEAIDVEDFSLPNRHHHHDSAAATTAPATGAEGGAAGAASTAADATTQHVHFAEDAPPSTQSATESAEPQPQLTQQEVDVTVKAEESTPWWQKALGINLGDGTRDSQQNRR